jgi:choline kinase
VPGGAGRQQPPDQRQVAALRGGGATEIGVVRGYRADMFDFAGMRYFDNPRWAKTNMVMSLTAAAEWLRTGPVLVSYADIFYRGDAGQRRWRRPPGRAGHHL